MTFDILSDLRLTLDVSMFEKMHHNSPSTQEYQTNVLKVYIQNVNVSQYFGISLQSHMNTVNEHTVPHVTSAVGSVSLTHHSQSSRSQAILFYSFISKNFGSFHNLFKIRSYFFSFLCKRNLHYCVCVCVCVCMRVTFLCISQNTQRWCYF